VQAATFNLDPPPPQVVGFGGRTMLERLLHVDIQSLRKVQVAPSVIDKELLGEQKVNAPGIYYQIWVLSLSNKFFTSLIRDF
jgi:hypothetical protein